MKVNLCSASEELVPKSGDVTDKCSMARSQILLVHSAKQPTV